MSNKQTRYDTKRPKLTWRMPEAQRTSIESVMEALGLSKQQFVDKLFALGFPRLQEAAGADPGDILSDHQLLVSRLTETLEAVTEQLRITQANSPLVVQADAIVSLAKEVVM